MLHYSPLLISDEIGMKIQIVEGASLTVKQPPAPIVCLDRPATLGRTGVMSLFLTAQTGTFSLAEDGRNRRERDK